MFPCSSCRCPVCGRRVHYLCLLVHRFHVFCQSSRHLRAFFYGHFCRNPAGGCARLHADAICRSPRGHSPVPLACSLAARNKGRIASASRERGSTLHENRPEVMTMQKIELAQRAALLSFGPCAENFSANPDVP